MAYIELRYRPYCNAKQAILQGETALLEGLRKAVLGVKMVASEGEKVAHPVWLDQ